MKENIECISLYFSADCNLKCKYCYINKDKPKLTGFNKRIIEKILDGSYAKNVIDKYKNNKDNITAIDLWGAEPTINSKYFKTLMFPLLDFFSSVKRIFFSTNCLIDFDRGIKVFIDAVEEYNKINDKNIILEIQMSLDGPDWLVTETRGIKSKKIIDNLENVIDYANNVSLQIDMHFKPTLDMPTIKILNDENEKLIGWYKFFDNIADKFSVDNFPKNVDLTALAYPTIVNPDQYTIDDGKEFAKFVKNISEIDTSQFNHYKHPLFIQPIKIIRELKSNNYKVGHCACGAGNGSYSIDCDGTLYTCHRLFMYTVMPEKTVACITDHHICYDNKLGENKLDLLNTSYHDNLESRFKFYEIMMIALASSGQIDECYNEREYRLLLFELVGAFLCHIGQGEETKDQFIAQTGYIKLLGNGALQEVLKYIKRCDLI